MAAEIEIQLLADIRDAVSDLKQFQKQATNSFAKTENAAQKATTSLTGFQKGIGAAGKALIGLAAGFASIAAAKAAVRLLDDFETSLKEINSIIPLADRNNKDLRNSLIDVSKQFGTSAQSQAKAYYQIVSAGIQGAAEQNDALIAANKLAIGGLTDTSSAINILTDALNTFGDQGLTANDAADTLFTTVRLGKTTVGELASSLGRVLPSAKALGVSFIDVNAALATLTTRGLSTAERTTQLNALFTGLIRVQQRLGKENRNVAEAFSLQALRTKDLGTFLRDLNNSVGGSAEELTRLLGSAEAVNAVLSLNSDNFVALNKNIGAFADRAGAADDAANELQNTIGNQLNQIVSNLQGLFLEISGTSVPGLVDALKDINKALSDISANQIKVFFQDLVTDIKIVIFEMKRLGIAADGIGKAFSELFSGNFQGVLAAEREAREEVERLRNELAETTRSSEKLNAALKEIDGGSLPATPQQLTDALTGANKQVGVLVSKEKTLRDVIADVNKQQEKVAKITKTVVGSLSDAVKESEKIKFDPSSFSTLETALKNIGLSQRQIIEQELAERLRVIRDASQADATLKQRSLSLETQARLDAEQKLQGLKEKNAKDLIEEETKLRAKAQQQLANPFQSIQQDGLNVSNIIGAASVAGKGREGAEQLAGFGADVGGQALGLPPGAGQAIFDLFKSGADGLRASLTEFFQTLPELFFDVIDALVDLPIIILEAAPEFITRLLEKLPLVINRLIEGAFQFISALISKLPEIAVTFIKELIKNVPTLIKAIIEGLVKGIGDIFGSFGDLIFGGSSGGLLGGGGFLGLGLFAEGGMVPGGSPFVDRVPALLTPGEIVVDRSLTNELADFLIDQKTSNNDNESINQLQIAQDPQTNLTVNLQVGEKQLAEVLLNLNKQGFRTA